MSNDPTRPLLQEVKQNIKRFWELDAVPETVSTQYHDEPERYVVRLPFKQGGLLLGNSRKTAINQCLKLEELIKK